MYKPFPHKELVTRWDLLIKKDRDFLLQLEIEWEDIDKENNILSKENYEKREESKKEIVSALRKTGSEPYKYRKNKFPLQVIGCYPWFKPIKENIEKKYPIYSEHIPKGHMGKMEIDGVLVTNNQSPTGLVELYDKIYHQYKKGLKTKVKKNDLFKESIKYAMDHQVDISELTPDAIVKVVEEVARDKYREEALPDGTELYLKHECEYCDSYTVGERRCSCGNRRISVVVEGNLIDGFTYYTEPF